MSLFGENKNASLDDFAMREMPPIMEKTLFELDVITNIQRGEKMSTSTGDYLSIEEDRGLLASASRFLRNDGRVKTLSKIIYTIQLSTELCEHLLESKYLDFPNKYASVGTDAENISRECLRDDVVSEYREYVKRCCWLQAFCNKLSRINVGLTNFMHTYEKDMNIVGRIRPQLLQTNAFVERLQEAMRKIEQVSSSSSMKSIRAILQKNKKM